MFALKSCDLDNQWATIEDRDSRRRRAAALHDQPHGGRGGGGGCHLTSTNTTNPLLLRREARKLWHGYLQGQIFSVGKAALWWSTIGLLCISIIRSDLALGVMRLSFNLALLIASPLAVQGAEMIPLNRLLINTTLLRLITWTLCTPLIFMTAIGGDSGGGGGGGADSGGGDSGGDHSSFEDHHQYLPWIFLGIIMFTDGVGAAYANSVDIDCGGLDILALEYDLHLTDFMRYKYTNTHQIIFDSSFLCFVAPIMIALDYLITTYETQISSVLPAIIIRKEDFIFGITCVALFSILSLCSLQSYTRSLPARGIAAAGSNSSVEEKISWRETYETKLRELVDGLIIVLDNDGLKWRLIFLAAETALEDSMVSIIIPLLALYLSPSLFGRESILLTAGVSCFAIGVGKMGGLLASRFGSDDLDDLLLDSNSSSEMMMSESMIEPEAGAAAGSSRKSSSRLFSCVLWSALSLILLPIGFTICEFYGGTTTTTTTTTPTSTSSFPRLLGSGLCLLSIFLFFSFSAAPKTGFSSLIQDCLNYDEFATPAVFGFIGVLVTITDGTLILILNVLFYAARKFNLIHYLLLTLVLVYLVLAILEKNYGTNLIKVRSRSNIIQSGSRSARSVP